MVQAFEVEPCGFALPADMVIMARVRQVEDTKSRRRRMIDKRQFFVVWRPHPEVTRVSHPTSYYSEACGWAVSFAERGNAYGSPASVMDAETFEVVTRDAIPTVELQVAEAA